MKIKTMLTLAAALFCTADLAVAQATDAGRCGKPRGTCGNRCDGSGFSNQGRGNGNGQGMRRNQRGNGKGAGDQQRQQRRDGSGSGRKQGA